MRVQMQSPLPPEAQVPKPRELRFPSTREKAGLPHFCEQMYTANNNHSMITSTFRAQ